LLKKSFNRFVKSLYGVRGSFPFAVELGVGMFEEGIGKAQGRATWRRRFFGTLKIRHEANGAAGSEHLQRHGSVSGEVPFHLAFDCCCTCDMVAE
jgi:hypothetical protein